MPTADVFISYAKDTKPRAEELAKVLQQHLISTWADFKDLQPGQRWQEEIERAAERAQFFLILVGPDSSGTPMLEAEWRVVLAKAWADSQKTVIPIIFGDGEPPPFLQSWVPLRIDSGTESAKWTQRLLEAMQSRCDRLDPAMSGNRTEHEKRLDELSRAAEELQRRESGSASSSKPK